jgi:O-antigen/teichoic acid export membrane protein
MTARRSVFGAERLIGASIWRFTFLGLQGGASVVLFAILGHALPRNAFAATALAQGVLVIAQAIGDFGLSQAAVTMLPARIAAAPDQERALLAGASLAYLGAGTAALALTLLSIVFVPSAAVVPIAVSAPAAAATVLVTGADGILRSRGEFRRPVLLMAASEIGGFIGIPVAIATRSADWTCVAVSIGTTLGAAGAVMLLVRLLAPGAPAMARPFARASVPLGLSQVFIVLGTRFDTLLAAALSGLLAAGTFEGDWRTYQLGQYAVGALATAAAPFVADKLGAGEIDEALHLLGQLMRRLLVVGLAVGAVLYLARDPIAHALAGSLARPVAGGLPILSGLSPLGAVTLAAFYTLIARDGHRRYVLFCVAVGAVTNLAVAAALAPSLHVHGVLIGCVAGSALSDVLILARLATLVRSLRQGAAEGRVATIEGGSRR